MTYPLGTTLIFTSLTQASAAADLFGDYALETRFSPEAGCMGWEHGFDLSHRHWGKWRIVLDTEEKVQWFTVQVGDLIYIQDTYGNGLDASKYVISEGEKYYSKIILRNGKPFPTPQEVITEESL